MRRHHRSIRLRQDDPLQTSARIVSFRRRRYSCQRNVYEADLRRQIAYDPQEPYLFQGSIAENIRMGRPDATEEEIREAAKQAHAHDFIMEFPEGYDTTVGERGNNLSGGQRQRIAIARAILKDTSIILLDEATSALDNESEQAVNEALRNLQGQKTILMIAHRPSTVELADRVCNMGYVHEMSAGS